MTRKFLRRYTDLPALIYLLGEKKLTLLDPQTWDDRNDAYYLRLYRDGKKMETVLALCFTQASETYHHWRVFANGPGGASISFKRKELLSAVKKRPGVRIGSVRYSMLKEIRSKRPSLQELPFLKRYPFEDEREFRIIYQSSAKESHLDIPISLSCIDKVTLNPWLNKTLFDRVKEMLLSLKGCEGIRVSQSTLISNEQWKKLGEGATGRKK
jgi:hypothetical protein